MSNFNVLEFLKVYRKYPVLWDKKHKYFKNKTARNLVEEVLLPVSGLSSVKELRAKIRTLRCTYNHEIQKIKSRTVGDNVYTPKLRWFTFADSFLKRNREYSKIQAPTVVSSDIPEVDTEIEIQDVRSLLNNHDEDFELQNNPMGLLSECALNVEKLPDGTKNIQKEVDNQNMIEKIRILSMELDNSEQSLHNNTMEVSSTLPTVYVGHEINPRNAKCATKTKNNGNTDSISQEVMNFSASQSEDCDGTLFSRSSDIPRTHHMKHMMKVKTPPKFLRNTTKGAKISSTDQVNDTTSQISCRCSTDEFTIFGQHVATQLSKLPINHALLLQENIQKLITRARLRAIKSSIADETATLAASYKPQHTSLCFPSDNGQEQLVDMSALTEIPHIVQL